MLDELISKLIKNCISENKEFDSLFGVLGIDIMERFDGRLVGFLVKNKFRVFKGSHSSDMNEISIADPLFINHLTNLLQMYITKMDMRYHT